MCAYSQSGALMCGQNLSEAKENHEQCEGEALEGNMRLGTVSRELGIVLDSQGWRRYKYSHLCASGALQWHSSYTGSLVLGRQGSRKG